MTTQAERRRQIGADNKNARQASGRAMRDDMRALSETPKVREPLPVVPKRGSMDAARGRGIWSGAEPSTGGGGIASPLTETPDAREYYASGVKSSDGLFFIPAIKTMIMRDADNELIPIYFAEPSEPEVEP